MFSLACYPSELYTRCWRVYLNMFSVLRNLEIGICIQKSHTYQMEVVALMMDGNYRDNWYICRYMISETRVY